MQNEHVRPRTVQFEDEVYVQNARTSSTNTTNSAAKTVVNKTLSEDKCYECLAVGDDDDEDGGELSMLIAAIDEFVVFVGLLAFCT